MKKWLMWAALVGASVGLFGCSAGGGSQASSSGSGSGSGSGGSSTTTVGSVALSLSTTTISSAAPATVTAKVLDSNSKAIAGAVVSFTVNSAVGSLSAKAALTDSSGIATVVLSPASASTTGADTITASTTVNSTTVTASAGYQLTATSAAFSSFTTVSGAGGGSAAGSALAAYGQTVLTASLTGVSVSAPVTLNLTSPCVALGKATISPATVTNTSGTATFTYKDSGGCGSTYSSDTVTATINGATTSTSSVVYLTPPTANSITFTSSSPNTIYLKGSGYTESATVKFQVVDTAGNALPGQSVKLNLSTFAGGLLLNQGTSEVTQTSDANGYVSAIVNSGTVPTPVRVTATLPSGTTAQSSDLTVAVGLPSQIHFSLSQTTINIEGAQYDGVPNTYTVYASDRSGNPVPDATSIVFWAEGGQIASTASTVNGSATAAFKSASPKPADGRVTVLAYAIGEESFIDNNGTNVYALGDPFQDLGDVVKSVNFDNNYSSANGDEVVALSGSGATSAALPCDPKGYNVGNFTIDPLTPTRPNTCDQAWSPKTYVRKAVETVFSTSAANPYWASNTGPASCVATNLYPGPLTTTTPKAYYSLATNANYYLGGAAGAFTIVAADANLTRLNPMPAGTTVSIASADGSVLTVSVTGGSPVPSSPTATGVSFVYKFLTSAASMGATITFTSPKGVVTPVPVTLYQAAAPSTCP